METREHSSFGEKARNHFAMVLGNSLEKLNMGDIPRDQNGILRVLSVGCGHGYDAGAVLAVFPRSAYKGIDIDEEIIESAKRLNSDIDTERVEYLKEDAQNVANEEKNKYGLVIIRNPQPGGTSIQTMREELSYQDKSSGLDAYRLWKDIIHSSIEKTANGGYLFITTDLYVDKQKIEEILDEKNVKHSTLFNKESPPPGVTLSDATIIIGQVRKSK